MDIFEIILIGVGLSMDAFAVTISNMFVYRNLSRARMMLMPVTFGFSQGIMPLIGYFAGTFFADMMSRYAGIISFLILGFIGGKMIWDALHEEPETNALEKNKRAKTLTLSTLLLQGIATAIDALFVGVSFAALAVEPISSCSIIALTTFLCVCVALLLGKRFGILLGERAALVGGVVLILIGLKALLS